MQQKSSLERDKVSLTVRVVTPKRKDISHFVDAAPSVSLAPYSQSFACSRCIRCSSSCCLMHRTKEVLQAPQALRLSLLVCALARLQHFSYQQVYGDAWAFREAYREQYMMDVGVSSCS
jgi:hypothetical protein